MCKGLGSCCTRELSGAAGEYIEVAKKVLPKGVVFATLILPPNGKDIYTEVKGELGVITERETGAGTPLAGSTAMQTAL